MNFWSHKILSIMIIEVFMVTAEPMMTPDILWQTCIAH